MKEQVGEYSRLALKEAKTRKVVSLRDTWTSFPTGRTIVPENFDATILEAELLKEALQSKVRAAYWSSHELIGSSIH